MIKKDIVSILKKVLKEEKIAFSKVEIGPSKFGDYSSNIALRIGKFKNYQTPLEVANYLLARIEKIPLISEATISPPGFINFRINQKEAAKYIPKITKDLKRSVYEKNNRGKFARLEFISANPTGPLHIGNARGGPLGDSLANILKSSGYSVLREYYNNNIGTQVDIFGDRLIYLISKKFDSKIVAIEDETKTYNGTYMEELANKLIQKLKLKNLKETQKKSSQIKKEALKILTDEIILTAKNMGIEFDEFFNESKFQEEGLTQKIVEELINKSVAKTKDNALWFAPKSEFLNDKESVLIRSNGRPTYFADDIAYHELKFKSEPDLVINILGSNHHGHVARLQAAVVALGFDISKFKVILYQYVRVKRGNDVVKMSKRAGNFVTAQEVLDEVGKDALRFLLLMHSPNSHLDFDLELAKKETSENPVFYVQYAHARMNSILSKAPEVNEEFDPSLLKTQEEFNLIKKILELPSLVEEISETFAVHQLAFFSMEIADLFHKFYENNRVITQDQKLTFARLELVRATKVVLAETLTLLGVSAPDKM